MNIAIQYIPFGRVRKISKSDDNIRYVRPSARMEHLGFRWTDFHET